MQPVVEGSPRPTARTIGVVYVLYFLTGIFGALLMKGLVVPTDAVATAQNLLAHESLYRSGWEVGLVANALYIAVTALFYGLLAPVNRSLAVMMAFFSLVGCTIQIFGGLLQLAPLTILGDNQLAGAFTVVQLRAAALLSFKLYPQVFYISLVLFGLFDLLLIIRRAQQDGSWSRLKVCANPDCRWAFYDRSRNQQGNWCNMALCGNRLKNRQLRARRR